MSDIVSFREIFSPRTHRPWTAEHAERLSARLPAETLELLTLDGFASYGEQLLWSVDPDELGEAVKPWLPGEETATPLLRTAFGELFLFNGMSVFHADIHLHTVTPCALLLRFFYSQTLVDPKYRARVLRPTRVLRAREALGSLEPHECYVYDPPLARGGDPEAARFAKADLRETLVELGRAARIARA